MFTDKTFYVGDIFIANLNETCDNLNFFHWKEQHEELCLRITLGDCLYNELMEQVEWNEDNNNYTLKAGVDKKWSWLLNGHTYEQNNIQTSPFNYSHCGCNGNNCNIYHWDGIIKQLDRRIPEQIINGQSVNGVTINTSYLAYYIYWLWSLNEDSFTSSTGEQTADVKNANRISNAHKRINAYNKFVSWVTSCNSHGRVGLYHFMQDFSGDFPTWQGKCLKYEPIW